MCKSKYNNNQRRILFSKMPRFLNYTLNPREIKSAFHTMHVSLIKNTDYFSSIDHNFITHLLMLFETFSGIQDGL